MKRSAFLAISVAALHPLMAVEQLAIWHFNNGLEDIFQGTDIHPDADRVVGLPKLEMFYQDIDANGSDGTDYTDVRGINHESPADNDAIRWDDIRGSGTDGQLDISLDTRGYENLSLRFDYRYRNNLDGTQDDLLFQYSANGGLTYSTFGALSYTDDDTWRSVSISLAGVPAIDDNPGVIFRIILDPAASPADEVNKDVYYDNIEITGELVPSGPQDPELLVDQLLTTDRLALKSELVGQVNGTIDDPTDPAATEGIYFSTTDPQPSDLVFLGATSSNQSVVPDANLTLTFIDADTRRLQIEPAGVGNTIITVTLSDTASPSNTDKYYIDYAASAASSTPESTRYHTIRADASTGVASGSSHMLVADDENQTIRLFDRSQSGYRLKAWNFNDNLGLASYEEADLEASLRAGNVIYWMGSHGNKKSGNSAPERELIFMTEVTGTGQLTELTYSGKYTGLKADIINWDFNGLHGLGNNYLGLDASAAGTPERVDGFNIEALARMPGSSSSAYIGFRAPLTPASGRADALVVPLLNLSALLTGLSSTASFGAPIELDLGGRGIRSMTRNANDEYLILAGPPASTGSFALYLWDGNAASPPVLLATDVDARALEADASPEGLLGMADSLDACTRVRVLMDGGDTILYGDGLSAKRHPVTRFRKFRSDSVEVPPQGDDYVVSNTHDTGAGSLRRAIECANAKPGLQTITFDLGTGSHTIPLDSEIEITDEVTITAPEDLSVSLSGQGASRIFTVSGSGGMVQIVNLRMMEGFSTGDGGALKVMNGADLRVRGCELIDNVSNGRGGAVYVEQAELTLRNTTLANNQAKGNGGAVNANNLSVLKLTQSTLSANTSEGHGGGLFALAVEVRILNSTITDNEADAADNGFDGGGIRRGAGSTTISIGNSVIALNRDASSSGNIHPDVSGDFASLGNNFTGIADGSTGLDDKKNNDRAGTAAEPLDPMISALQLNGGSILNHKPLFDSPLIESAEAGLFSDRAWDGIPPVFDQRGNDRIQNSLPDIGTIEFIPIVAHATYLDKLAFESPDNNRIGLFRVTRDRSLNQMTVTFGLVSQSGSGGFGDFTLSASGAGSASGNSVTFPAGVSQVEVVLTPVDDALLEQTEVVGLQLQDGRLYVDDPAYPYENITIYDNDRLVTSYADSGPGTLREAVSQISPAGGGLIVFDNQLSATGPRPRTVNLGSPLFLTEDIIIEGPEDNAAGVAVDGGGGTHLFEVRGAASVTLRNLTIQGGKAAQGGGIRLGDSADLTVESCAIINNTAVSAGGGIYTDSSGRLLIRNTTLSGNEAGGDGGGIHTAGTDILLAGATVTRNTADADMDGSGRGGGLAVAGGTTLMESTILAGNVTHEPSGAPDYAGSIDTGGGNLVGINDGTGANPASFPAGSPNSKGDFVGFGKAPVDPRLFPLAFKGGPTPVHALGCGSIALDNGVTGNNGPEDQRGLPRIANGGIDIGACEHQYLDYAYWRDFTFPRDEDATSLYAANLDWDGDGQSSGLERILGSDPDDPDSIGRTWAELEAGDLLLSFTRDVTLDPVHVGGEASTDLGKWGSSGLILEESCPTSPDALNPSMSLRVPRTKPEVFGRVFYIP